MKIEAIYVSSGHDFFRRYGLERRNHRVLSLDSVTCVKGMGLKGDRFFGYKEDYKGQVSFFSAEIADALRKTLEVPPFENAVFRRNIITRGVDLNTLIGREFKIGQVKFQGTQEAAPCDWMEVAVGPGARAKLEGNGGLRARILTTGILEIGELNLLITD